MVKMIAKGTIQTTRVVREARFKDDAPIVQPGLYGPGEEFEADVDEAKRLEELGVAERATKAAQRDESAEPDPLNDPPASGDTRAPDPNVVGERSRLDGKPRG